MCPAFSRDLLGDFEDVLAIAEEDRKAVGREVASRSFGIFLDRPGTPQRHFPALKTVLWEIGVVVFGSGVGGFFAYTQSIIIAVFFYFL